MLTIRPRQLSLLANERFASRMAIFLREAFSAARKIEPATLHEAVRKQAERAQRYGLTEEGHVSSYVVSAWLLGEEFDQKFSAAASVLGDSNLSGAEKAKWLDEWTVRLFEALEGLPP